MKNWNAPEVKELNINETANGIFDCEWEFWPIVNDDNKKPEQKPVTPEDKPENKLS